MYITQTLMADSHDYTDNTNNTNHHSIPDDERLHLLDVDCAYCDVDQVYNESNEASFKTTMYCAL